jgi:aminoglycoside 2''-phosphotransferase
LTLTEVTKTILRSCPGWILDSIYFLAEGDDYSVYVVNDEWVCRVAKHAEARASLRREYCLLPALADQITLRIPSPQIALLEENAALPFIAYPLLPGPALSQELYFGLDDAGRTRCAEQVAHFLTQMHSVDIRLAQACGVPPAGYVDQYSDLLSQAQEELFAILDEPECLFIERVIGSYLESGDASNFRPMLLHGDLSPDHVLFDEQAEKVSTIIDFGDMMIGDSAWDFVYIYEDYGLDFLSRVLTAYSGPDRISLLGRVYQFYLLDAIDWAVSCRLRADAFREAMTQLRMMRMQEEQRFEELLSACCAA